MKKIYIPSNLNLKPLVGKEFQKDADIDRMHYIINLIYEQRILYKIKEEYVPLKALYLRRLLGRATEINDIHNYNDYIQELIRVGVIACDRHYIVSEKSFGYKLCDEYSKVRHMQVPITSASLDYNIKKWQFDRIPTTKVHAHLYQFLQQIEIDYTEALEYINTFDVDEYNHAKISIDRIKEKAFYIYNDEFGRRVHTNITNLKSTLRKYINYRGSKLVNIDIANSQPLLLLLVLKSSFHIPIRCPKDFYFEDFIPDVVNYQRLVEKGELYNYLMRKSGENDREKFKEKFFREVFFGKNTSRLFCSLFPTIGEKIKIIKKRNYKRLSMLMQRAEAKLIISKVCRQMMLSNKNAFITTIHDSILTTPDHVSTISGFIAEEFGKFGISPTVRVEE